MANRFDRFFNVDEERGRVKAIRDEILHGKPAQHVGKKRVCGCVEFEVEE